LREFEEILILIKLAIIEESKIVVDGGDEEVEEELFGLETRVLPPVRLHLFFRHGGVSGLNVFNDLRLALYQHLKILKKLVSLLFWHFIVILQLKEVLVDIEYNRVVKEVVVKVHLIQRNHKILVPDSSGYSNNVWKGALNDI